MKRIISLIFLIFSVSLFAEQWRGIAVTSEDISENVVMFNRALEGEIVFITSIDSGKSIHARVGGKVEDGRYVALLSQSVAQELNIAGNAGEVVIDTTPSSIPTVQLIPKEYPIVVPALETVSEPEVSVVQLLEVLPPYVQSLPEAGVFVCGTSYRHSKNDIPQCLQIITEEPVVAENVPQEEELFFPEELSESLSAAFMAEKVEEKAVNWLDKLEKGKVYIKILSSSNKKELEEYSKMTAMFFNDGIVLYEAADLRYELLLGPIAEDDIGKAIRIVRGYGYKDAYLIRGK